MLSMQGDWLRKYNHNPGKWSDNVEFYLRNKTKPEFYNDSVVKGGYARGDKYLRLCRPDL